MDWVWTTLKIPTYILILKWTLPYLTTSSHWVWLYSCSLTHTVWVILYSESLSTVYESYWILKEGARCVNVHLRTLVRISDNLLVPFDLVFSLCIWYLWFILFIWIPSLPNQIIFILNWTSRLLQCGFDIIYFETADLK